MKPNKSSLIQEETINTILDFFKNIPFSRLIEIKREEHGNMRTDVWYKERSAHLKDGDYSPNKGVEPKEKRLYIIRRENRLHQKDLAKALGIHPPTYYKKVENQILNYGKPRC